MMEHSHEVDGPSHSHAEQRVRRCAHCQKRLTGHIKRHFDQVHPGLPR